MVGTWRLLVDTAEPYPSQLYLEHGRHLHLHHLRRQCHQQRHHRSGHLPYADGQLHLYHRVCRQPDTVHQHLDHQPCRTNHPKLPMGLRRRTDRHWRQPDTHLHHGRHLLGDPHRFLRRPLHLAKDPTSDRQRTTCGQLHLHHRLPRHRHPIHQQLDRSNPELQLELR